MENLELNIGLKIKKLREQMSLTQQQLAERLGISKSTLGMYETNKREPNLLIIKKICYELKTDGNYLLGFSPIISSNNNYNQLNEAGKRKADEYINDLLVNPKYTEKIHIIKQAARDGTFTEIHATDSEIQEMLKNINELPDVDDDL